VGTDAASRRLHRLARADRWGLEVEDFAAAVDRSVAAATRAKGGPVAAESLHLEDLALARACARGHEGAWEHFVREYRPVLYRAADALDPGGGAREVADALYADLFGLAERDGERRSLFDYFHGRSSLATWLRAVLGQRLVDRARAARRLEPLDDAAPVEAPAAPDAGRVRDARLVQAVLRAALASLAAADRMKLALYYREQLTLAQIGRLTGGHEATVSRHLARIRAALRARMIEGLCAGGLSGDEAAAAIEAVASDAGPLDLAELLGADSKMAAEDRSQ
jgi:RNA polymerase sigma-70 factor (ECF subfamily)